jgi:hypothetical protein
MKYLIDFDSRLSEDKKTLELIREGNVIERIEGEIANDFYKKLVRIDELKTIGFSYCFLEFDGKLDEWYEKVLVEPSTFCEGVTILYHPETDNFEVPEQDMKFSEIEKAEAFIKAFKQ